MDFPAADSVDLFVKNPTDAPPAQWAAGVVAGSLLYAQPEPDICMMPEVGNGFIASILGFASMHVSGFFNGGCGGVSNGAANSGGPRPLGTPSRTPWTHSR